MANKEIGDWNPMEEAHRNPAFNSYVEGPGANLNAHHQPFNRGGGGGGRGRTSGSTNRFSEFTLYIRNVPMGMSREGLATIFRPYAVPKSIHLPDKKPGNSTCTWATVEFDTYGDAEHAMRGCNEKPPYNLLVSFARPRNQRNDVRDNERQPFSPASSTPRVNQSSFQGIPQRSPASAATPKSAGNSVTPKSAGNSVTPKSVGNSGPNQPSNFNQSLNNSSNQGADRHCKLCQTKTSGVCGACKNVSYCSQDCATQDFKNHVTDCYVPVPAVCFMETASQGACTPMFSPVSSLMQGTPNRQQNEGHSNSRQYGNGDSANASIDIGAAGDNFYNCPHSGIKKDKISMNADTSNKSIASLATGDTNPSVNEGILGNAPLNGRNYSNGSRPAFNGFQDTSSENISTSTPNKKPFGNPTPFNKQAKENMGSGSRNGSCSRQANENIGPGSSRPSMKKQRLALEDLEIGIPTEVEVAFNNKYNLYVVKLCNRSALDTLHKGLASTSASMLPYDKQQEVCAAFYEGELFRGRVLMNKNASAGNDSLRVKYVDFGNVSMLNAQELRSLPETFFELPAQAIQLKFQGTEDGSYASHVIGSKFTVTAIEKIDGSWIVDAVPVQTPSPQSRLSPSAAPVQTASPQSKLAVGTPQTKSDAVVNQTTPLPSHVATASPAVALSTTPIRVEQVSSVAETSHASVLPPVGIFTMVTVTNKVSDTVFWGTLTSSKEEIAAMEEKLNKLLEANPSPCQPVDKQYVAVYYDGCWYRAKVLRFLDSTVRLGLIDYGEIIESPPENINSLPDELKEIPQQAGKFRITEGFPVVLQVDMQICVKLTSTEVYDKCFNVVVKTQVASSSVKQENKEHTVKFADVKPVFRITSLEEEHLPIDDYVEVTVTEIAGKSFWVNMTANTDAAFAVFKALHDYSVANPTPCHPAVGDFVAAPFQGHLYRAKVLTVLPVLRVFFVDYGNECEVPLDQIKVLPKELTLLPAQAIKITFSESTSPMYHNLKGDAKVRVKPVAAGMKSADHSVIVQVEGDSAIPVAAAATPAPPAQATPVTVASKGLWYPLRSVEMPTGKFVDLTIVVPGKTGFASLTENSNAISELIVALYETMHKSRAPCQPQVGDIIAVIFDGMWYRAKVLDVVHQLKVALVDYGNTILVSPDDIGCLPTAFHDLPGQAFKITFIDGTSEEYFNLTEEFSFKGKVQKKLPDGTVLIEACDLKRVSGEAPALEAAPVPTIPSCAPPVVPEQELGCSQREPLPPASETEANVTYAENGEVWVNIAVKNPELDQLMDTFMIMEKTLKPSLPKVGTYVSARFYGVWHRGKVLSVSESKSKVFLIDYGNVIEATSEDLRALPDELNKLPAQGVPLSFCPGSAEKSTRLNLGDKIYVVKAGTVNLGNLENVNLVMCLNK